MKLLFAGTSVSVLMLVGGAMADPLPVLLTADASDTINSTRKTSDTIEQIASVTQQIVQTAAFAVEPVVQPTQPAATMASTAVTPMILPAKLTVAAPTAKDRLVKADRRSSVASSREPPAAIDSKAMCVRPIGKTELGTAAWYGGTYLGRRTSSGEVFDAIHETAAHRTLPLNSLARVTNLKNGKSVIVRVTDRGPISPKLLIDMSPRAADQLEMKTAGLVPVRVEQVVEVPPEAK